MAQAGWQCIVQTGGSPATVGDLTSAEITINGQVYDVTQLGHQWMDRIGGLADYQLKLAGNFNMSDAQQASLQAAMITNPGSIVQWQIAPKGLVPTTRYSGSIILKQEGLKFPVNAKADVTFDGDSTGALVFTA